MPQNHHATSVDRSEPAGFPLGRVWIAAFAAGSVLYVLTCAPGILWGDSGEAQLRVLIGQLQDNREIARSHVTYFATALGLTRAFGLAPITTANMVSALAGALTVANFAVLCACLVRTKTALIGGTLLLLLSHTLWQMSAGAEVVTFSTMLLTFELVCVIRFSQNGRFIWLAGAALANGLGWSTHNFTMLIWPAYGVLLLARPEWLAQMSWRRWITLSLVWLLGTAPLCIALLSRIGQLNGTEGALQSVFVGIYADNVFNLHITLAMAMRVAAYVCLNFPTPLLLLVPFGLRHLYASQPKSLALFLNVASISFFVFAARYDVPDQYTFLVHSHVFLALFMAIGLDFVLSSRRHLFTNALALSLCCLAPGLYAVLPGIAERYLPSWAGLPQRVLPYRQPLEWFLQPWRCGNEGAERYAREVLGGLPENAVLLVDSTTGRPIDLVQESRGLRRDVTVPHRRFDRPWQAPLTLDRDIAHRLISNQRLFSVSTEFRSYGNWKIDEDCQYEPFGHVFRVTRDRPPDEIPIHDLEPAPRP